jgi:hypothetical protein
MSEHQRYSLQLPYSPRFSTGTRNGASSAPAASAEEPAGGLGGLVMSLDGGLEEFFASRATWAVSAATCDWR